MGKPWERSSSCHDHEYTIANRTAAISWFPRLCCFLWFLTILASGTKHDIQKFIPNVHHPRTENGIKNRFEIVIFHGDLKRCMFCHACQNQTLYYYTDSRKFDKICFQKRPTYPAKLRPSRLNLGFNNTQLCLIRQGWVLFEWSRIHFTKHFIEFVFVETNEVVRSNSNVILTRQTCSHRLSRVAGSKRRALAFQFSVQIGHMFSLSICRGKSGLSVCMTWVLAKRLRPHSDDFRFQNVFSRRIRRLTYSLTYSVSCVCPYMCMYVNVHISMYIYVKGGPEPLENEINKILGSKREDRF